MPVHSQARSDTGRSRFESSSTTDWAALEQQLSRTKTILQEILEHLQGVLQNLRAARAGHKGWARGATRTEKPGPKPGFRSARPGAAAFGARAQEAKGPRPRPGHARFERAAGATAGAGGATASGRPSDSRREQSAFGGQTGASGQSGQTWRSSTFGQGREEAGPKTAPGSPYRTSSGNRATGGAGTSTPGDHSTQSGPFGASGRAQAGTAGASAKTGQTGQPGSQNRASFGQSRQRETFGQASRPGQTRTFHGSNAYDTRRETIRPDGAARHRYSGERQERGRQTARVSGMNLKCAYDILCLDYPCSPTEIKDAYRGMARMFHPDLGGDEEVMKDINLAYELAMRFCAGPRRSGASWSV